MFYVYVLKSLKDGKLYFGQTNNIKARITQHFYGKVLSTKRRRPLKLVGYRTYETRSEAMRVEHKIKTHGDQKKKFINSLFEKEGPPARRAYGPEGGDLNG
jgi:putative endonuclease